MISYSEDEALRRLIRIGNISISRGGGGSFAVELDGYWEKDGPFQIATCGRGDTFNEALADYIKRISGKTLIHYKTREEVKILL